MLRALSPTLPRLGLGCLAFCLASGVVLAFYYRPAGNVFRNVEEITTLVPYGKLFRQLHYGSGQAFVLFMLAHTLEHFFKERYRTYSPGEWSRLVTAVGLCLLILFTGFVLKGDKEGMFAGRIFMNMLRAVPVAGEHLSRLFVRPGDHFFFLPYLHHCFLLPGVLVYLTRSHIRRWVPGAQTIYLTGVGLVLFALLVPPRPALPPEAPVPLVTGPWFFLGLQSLLKTAPPFWAGIMPPVFLFAGLLSLPFLKDPWGRRLHGLLIGLLALYALLCLRAFLAGP